LSGKGRKARGLDLLRQVYAELYVHLGDRFSPADLLQAAQTLIDVSRDEYGNSLFQADHLYSGYYSLAVDVMIQKRPWWPLENECCSDQYDDEIGEYDYRTEQALKRFFGPTSNFKRDYW